MAYEIIITRPCTDTPGRFIAESAFGRKFNMGRLCAIVKAVDGAKDFTDVKCSENLGVARLDFKDKTLILYGSGRVDLRKVADEADARATMAELEALFSAAFE